MLSIDGRRGGDDEEKPSAEELENGLSIRSQSILK